MNIIITPEDLAYYQKIEKLLLDIRKEMIEHDVFHWRKENRLQVIAHINALVGPPAIPIHHTD
jgi:hypothetical protein